MSSSKRRVRWRQVRLAKSSGFLVWIKPPLDSWRETYYFPGQGIERRKEDRAGSGAPIHFQLIRAASACPARCHLAGSMNTPSPRHFETHGYLHLEGFHRSPAVAPLRQKLRGRTQAPAPTPKGGLSAVQRLPLFQQIGKLSALVNLPGLHEALVTSALLDLIAKLGHRAPPPAAAGHPGTQLLLSPPQQGEGTLQGLNWHVDLAARPQDPLPGVQAFFLIDDVAPHGGATPALAGSHASTRGGRLRFATRAARTAQGPAGPGAPPGRTGRPSSRCAAAPATCS